jgi:hypothetical protein
MMSFPQKLGGGGGVLLVVALGILVFIVKKYFKKYKHKK